ncbi:MAG: DUF2141 domain-containing protein [Gallionellaceae bacterium]|nr:MAG: DUF2141 domain-containing protein [Gallionellaceae bacterium]
MNRLFVLVLMLLVQNCLADDGYGNLTIRVNGLLHDRGKVIANLFRDGDNVMKIETAYLHVQGKINGQQAQPVFQNLKYGKYAVTIFHDENDNGTLDHNLLRMPAEPLGFSNGFQMGMLNGLPSFEKLQFIFGPRTDRIAITIK